MRTRTEPSMIYLPTILVVVWAAGLLFFIGRLMNDLRLVLNNLAPRCRPIPARAPGPSELEGLRLAWRICSLIVIAIFDHEHEMFQLVAPGVSRSCFRTSS